MISPKRRRNIPRIVTLQWFFLSNKNGYFATRDERHGIRVRGSGEDFASYFLWKIEISPTHRRDLKCNAGQEILPRPTRPGDISQQEIPKFTTCNHQSDLRCNGSKRVFNRRSTFWISGKKDVTEKKSKMMTTAPNSRD